jgi:hypothetical protein
VNGQATLSEVWQHIRQHAEDGLDCPACGRRVRIYRRNLNWEMAFVAIRLYRYHLEHPWDYSHVRDFTMSGQYAETFKNYNWLGDYSKLKWWGLIEEAPPAEGKSGKTGLWRITQLGIEWVTGKIKMPYYVLVFNAERMEYSDLSKSGRKRKPSGIRDALGTKFDFDALMRGE